MKRLKFLIISILGGLAISMTPPSQVGKVSWYGKKFHGKKTASGQLYDMNSLTCATTWNKETRKLGYPFGTKLEITNLSNGKSVIVEVNDTGSFLKYGRTLDLSKAAFDEIADLDKGVVKVKVERI